MNSSRLLLTSVVCLGLLAVVSSSPLNCSVTREPDGAFKYQLSQPHRSTCYISWEDHTKIVIAHIRSQNETLVQAQTNQSILMKDCWDFLHYHKDCHGVYEDADCSVNCSRLSDPEAPRPRHENQICFTQQFCRDQVFWLRLIGIVFAVVVVVAVAAVVIYQCVQKRRRRTQLDQVSNTRVAEEVKILLTWVDMSRHEDGDRLLPWSVFTYISFFQNLNRKTFKRKWNRWNMIHLLL